MKEIEVKILDIEPSNIRKILKNSGAEFIKKVFQKNYLYKNKYTKHRDLTVRIRLEDNQAILTVKSKAEFIRGLKVREENETEIGCFKTAQKIMGMLGLENVSMSEIKREYWKLNNCSIEICKMANIPQFLELEGSEKNIQKTVKTLGYSTKDYYSHSIAKAYGIKSKIWKF